MDAKISVRTSVGSRFTGRTALTVNRNSLSTRVSWFAGSGQWIGTKIMGGDLLTVDSYLVPNAERSRTLPLSKVTS